MGDIPARHLKIFCPQHKTTFDVAESPKIICAVLEHTLSINFPYNEFWEYCCDCRIFSPSDLNVGGKAHAACPRCERPTMSRFICDSCNVLTLDSGEETKDKLFHLSLESFAVEPSCPGCLTEFAAKKIHLHKCAEIKVVLETPRESCPFCKKEIVKKVEPKTRQDENLNEIKTEQGEFRSEIKKLTDVVMLLNEKLERHQKIIQALEASAKESGLEIKRLKEALTQNIAVPEMPKKEPEKADNASAAPPKAVIKDVPVNKQPVIKPASPFPVSVENYLKKVRQPPQKAAADIMRAMLVPNQRENAEFLIVKDSALEDAETFYALPGLPKFMMKTDYLLYYQDYYFCENPAGGEIWIVAPAIVRRVQDGWKLERKGELVVGLSEAQSKLVPKQHLLNYAAQARKPEPQFPVSVENYLKKIGKAGQKATGHTFSDGLLVQDSNKNAEFVIVKDPSLKDELFFAVPSMVRLFTQNYYFNFFQSYYTCENPAGGMVWIISPAIVQRVANGWKLLKKGKMEMR
jgi:hypothetical protein